MKCLGSRREHLSAVGERFPLHCTANGKAIFSSSESAKLIDKSLAKHPTFPVKSGRRLIQELETLAARISRTILKNMVKVSVQSAWQPIRWAVQ
ncbi:hypothetical protein JQ604_23930 [Bradyrhizobium jicamae]|nr:hypothetical protein [Bradyrhizobium jicamae]